ncbi:MAG: nucleotidyl transferase AbiEii/AbiGii toxin family protein [Solirubrobacteraceae bacterium]
MSGPEAGSDEIEPVRAIDLADFKLSGPCEIACLPLRFQIAQKLHAVTEGHADRENHRFRDLVDLLILRDLARDLRAVRRVCEATFAQRATSTWPPELHVPASWRAGYAELAREVGLDLIDVDAAAQEIRAFLAAIADA